MKTEGKGKQKLKQVLFRHQKKKLEEELKKKSCNCKFNKKSDLPKGFLSERSSIHLCVYQTEGLWRNLVCDDLVDPSTSKKCSFFAPRRSKEEIKKEFKDFIQKEDLGTIAVKYPDVSALMWILELKDSDFNWSGEEGSFDE